MDLDSWYARYLAQRSCPDCGRRLGPGWFPRGAQVCAACLLAARRLGLVVGLALLVADASRPVSRRGG